MKHLEGFKFHRAPGLGLRAHLGLGVGAEGCPFEVPGHVEGLGCDASTWEWKDRFDKNWA